MGERRGLNPRVVDSQSTALIHLATSAPTPAQVSVSIYDQILSEPPYDRYQREAFSYTIVASLLLCFGIRGRIQKSRSFLEKLQTKRLGCSLHWFDFTLLKIKEKIGAGRTVKARLVDSKRAASYGFDEQQAPTPNKMKSSKLRLKKRAPIRESHCALAPCIGWAFLSLRTPKLQALKPLLISIYGIFEEAPFYKPFYNIREARRAFFACLSASFPFLFSISKVVKRRNLSSFMTKLI